MYNIAIQVCQEAKLVRKFLHGIMTTVCPTSVGLLLQSTVTVTTVKINSTWKVLRYTHVPIEISPYNFLAVCIITALHVQ